MNLLAGARAPATIRAAGGERQSDGACRREADYLLSEEPSACPRLLRGEGLDHGSVPCSGSRPVTSSHLAKFARKRLREIAASGQPPLKIVLIIDMTQALAQALASR